MDAQTKRVFERLDSELNTVRELLTANVGLMSDLKTGLSILNQTTSRIEKFLQGLPCNVEPPCDERTPAETPAARRNRRLKVATG